MSLIFCFLFFIYSQEEVLDEGTYSEEATIEESSELGTDENSTPEKDFDTSTIEGRIAKYYYNREPINDEDWKTKIGSSFDEVYIIVAGDTLWSISEKFLDSPSYWPKIWSLNPYITNPHLIYPGNEIKFKFYSEDAPELSIGEPDYEDDVLQNKNQTDYSSLELEVKPYKFDKLGFLMSSSSLKTSKPETISYKNPFEFYLKNNLKILGKIKIIDAEKNIYSGDAVLIDKDSKFDCINSYSLVNKKASHYVLAGELTITDTNTCKAKISKLYDIVSNSTLVTELIQINELNATNSSSDLKGAPKYLDKELYSEGDNIFIEFDKNMPNIGEAVFFYEKNNLIGIGKILFNDKDISTVVILASYKPISKNVRVSTKN